MQLWHKRHKKGHNLRHSSDMSWEVLCTAPGRAQYDRSPLPQGSVTYVTLLHHLNEGSS